MKRIILFALCMGLLTSCANEYTAKDKDGAPMLIKDLDGVIEDAKALGLDSVYLRKSNHEGHFTVLRRMGESETIFWSDTINGEMYRGSTVYRIVHLANIIER